MSVTLVKGDATERWPLEDNSLDSIVTDPPYNLSFMSKKFDSIGSSLEYQRWSASWAKEAYRCLKPGGFLMAFGATRMAHRMTCGFEDAGFEILDSIAHIFLSGMPKAQDIGKMFDKRAGANRTEVIGAYQHPDGKPRKWAEHNPDAIGYHEWNGSAREITAPATDLAKQWDGWKTPSLKPAHEPIVCARKPLIGTYCENIERWGVGAFNVDACRVSYTSEADKETLVAGVERMSRNNRGDATRKNDGWQSAWMTGEGYRKKLEENVKNASASDGRFPANVVMTHAWGCTEHQCVDKCSVRLLDEQSGVLTSGKPNGVRNVDQTNTYGKHPGRLGSELTGYGDTGGASKIFAKFFYDEEDFVPWFYCPKASSRERNEGCESLQPRRASVGDQRESGDFTQRFADRERPDVVRENFHPTVKPLKLVQYLQRLCTPPGGTTASPFLGSGTDAVAAIREGFHFWGMNLPDRPGEEYWPIISARVAHALEELDKPAPIRAAKSSKPVAPPEQVAVGETPYEQARFF